MESFIALYLIVCLDMNSRDTTCTKIFVTDNSVVEMSMTECLGLTGAVTAQHYWDEHVALYKLFHFGGWSCKIGNNPAPRDGGA